MPKTMKGFYYDYKAPLTVSLLMLATTIIYGGYHFKIKPYFTRKRYREAEEWADVVYQQEIEANKNN